jgi:hypothetical protein
MRENAESKARRYLGEGRVQIVSCDEEAGTVMAQVRGSGAVYAASHGAKGWHCDCAARSKDCAHVLALKLVTALEPRASR